MYRRFSNIKISAIASASGKLQRDVESVCKSFLDEHHARRIIKTLGFEKVRQIPLEMTTADMCVCLCESIINALRINPESIDALVFVTQTNDSIAPASVFIMQDKLHLSEECYVTNIINGCSGSIHGMLEGASLIASRMAKRVLVCFGDTYCKYHLIEDSDQKANVALFGDGAGAVLLEESENDTDLFFNFQSHGQFAQAIHDSKGSERYERLKLGVKLGDLDSKVLEPYSQRGIQIDGTAIASYAIDYVVPNLKTLIEKSGLSSEEISVYLLHQANKTILKSVALCMGIPYDKIPFVAKDTGNTSSAALALALGETPAIQEKIKHGYTAFSAFGVGMNVASLLASLQNTIIIPTVYF